MQRIQMAERRILVNGVFQFFAFVQIIMARGFFSSGKENLIMHGFRISVNIGQKGFSSRGKLCRNSVRFGGIRAIESRLFPRRFPFR
jgi:hypothetical protein